MVGARKGLTDGGGSGQLLPRSLGMRTWRPKVLRQLEIEPLGAHGSACPGAHEDKLQLWPYKVIRNPSLLSSGEEGGEARRTIPKAEHPSRWGKKEPGQPLSRALAHYLRIPKDASS